MRYAVTLLTQPALRQHHESMSINPEATDESEQAWTMPANRAEAEKSDEGQENAGAENPTTADQSDEISKNPEATGLLQRLRNKFSPKDENPYPLDDPQHEFYEQFKVAMESQNGQSFMNTIRSINPLRKGSPDEVGTKAWAKATLAGEIDEKPTVVDKALEQMRK